MSTGLTVKNTITPTLQKLQRSVANKPALELRFRYAVQQALAEQAPNAMVQKRNSLPEGSAMRAYSDAYRAKIRTFIESSPSHAMMIARRAKKAAFIEHLRVTHYSLLHPAPGQSLDAEAFRKVHAAILAEWAKFLANP